MPSLDYELLSYGRASAMAGEKETARRYLEGFLRRSPPEDERLEALYWLSEVIDDPQEKRALLEEILACNLGDVRARKKLAILDGKIQPEEIVDPDHLPAPKENRTNGARSFTCPQCGGRMTYAPDGQSLICEYCESQSRLRNRQPAEEENFLLALATAKAQRRPIQQNVIECKGCGATFTLPPKVITHTCPFCQTPYAIEQVEIRELDAPDSVLPFKITHEETRKIIIKWLKENPPDEKPLLKSFYGVYLPAWIFTIGGQVDWTGWVYKNKKAVPVQGRRIINIPNILIPAVNNFPSPLEPVFRSFPLDELVAFDPGYLASFHAETFQISAADASLKAREMAVQKIKQDVPSTELSDIYNLTVKTPSIVVESYRLALLPLWMVTLDIGKEQLHMAINGYTGESFADKEHPPFHWLKKLLDF
ncbi:hypothetical protein [Anaerolinea thermophila]|uniref:Uncharacterized protein n=1 Tax=Anaerolinea thermophila (strain DSM 14523 / JCM 11388 / NBRC 100420 / UNI-1) TaxID=926569 RepID=E8N6D4_ANATU|nr:hypothetical protein [Anaerolinea thermophila]BAJ63998.1 hypothetical protein ANT_19720 [Anaerolinea thermophila UNI-1]